MSRLNKLLLVAAVASFPLVASTPATAQDDYRWNGDQNGQWDPSQHYNDRQRHWMSDNDRVYRGHDGRYYCKRSDGTTGLVLGAVGGGVIGNVLGGGTLGTVLGAGGGALLGRHLDKEHDAAQNRSNGYACD
jgi:hypothetical protein